MRLLLVEDDAMIGSSVQKGLRQAGFAIDWVRHAKAGDAALAAGGIDLLLLDLGLPGQSGLDWLKTVREQGLHLPVLILTARDTVAERVAGLNAGADDYLVKPFDLDELIARIHALLRRSKGHPSPVLRHGPLELDPARHRVTLHGEAVSLSAREFALLHALLMEAGTALSIRQLQEKIYDWDTDVGSNTVEVYIHALRKKLGAEFIRNQRGVGYLIPEA